ncbi:glycogen debranching enzyme, partial [Streptosporangium sandarakinum]
GGGGGEDIDDIAGRQQPGSLGVGDADRRGMQDLVSYNGKHNEANGEHNRDGTDDNRSWNCGAEGPASLDVESLREQQKRNFLTTLFLSQGVPMISHGDELGRTQRGNNNVYCQDNELSWVDWSDVRENWLLLEFTQKLARLRAGHPVFRRRRFFYGRPVRGSGDSLSDIEWFTPLGEKMTDADWNVGYARSLAVFLNGDAITEPDRRGRRTRDDSFLLLFNAHHDVIEFTIPKDYGEMWMTEIDTAMPITVDTRICRAGEEVPVTGRSVRVLRRV